jgi:8-oxo-dGTP diphosphatase
MNKAVICHDIKGNKFEITADKLSLRPSVYGVILKNNKVLLSKQWDGYDFPGGGIELGETIKEALIREVKEETGLAVKVGNLITCEDSFFKTPHEVQYVQSILLYYLCEVTGGEISTENFDKYEKEYAGMPEWIDIKSKDQIKFYNSVDSLAILNKVLSQTNSK